MTIAEMSDALDTQELQNIRDSGADPWEALLSYIQTARSLERDVMSREGTISALHQRIADADAFIAQLEGELRAAQGE